MTWMFIISTTIWVNGWDTSSVASRARSELTSSQCNWKGNRKGKGTDETPHGLLAYFSKLTYGNGLSANTADTDPGVSGVSKDQKNCEESKTTHCQIDHPTIIE